MRCKHCKKPIPDYDKNSGVIEYMLCPHCYIVWHEYHRAFYDVFKDLTFEKFCQDRKYDKVEKFVFR